MRITYITAGAGGMFCGSCLHDNTLAAALTAAGHDALLVPTYTPLTTDEADVSQKRVFLGGINMYLQQKVGLFRHTPWFLDRLLDAPGLLRWVSRFAVKTQADQLGDLFISVLEGAHGHQRKEVAKLVDWLAADIKPQIVNLTNVLLSGLVPPLRERLGVPILASLQGDDIFLESLPASYRERCLALVRRNCKSLDGFVATSRYYADFMADYLHLPREKVGVVWPGLNLKGHGGPAPPRDGAPFTVGYFARVCPEKGLHVLVDAYLLLRKMPGVGPCRLRVSGWLGENYKPFLDEQTAKLRAAGLLDEFDYTPAPDHETKVRFLQSLDVLSVPTVYREPKGLYVLEAWANGIPVVQPRHGSFPELLEAAGGGVLVNPEDPADLARGLRDLRDRPAERRALGEQARRAVAERFTARAMADATVALYRGYVP